MEHVLDARGIDQISDALVFLGTTNLDGRIILIRSMLKKILNMKPSSE